MCYLIKKSAEITAPLSFYSFPTTSSEGGGCFPSLAEVKLKNGKSVTMSELQIGDQVQTGMKSVTMSELQIGDQVQTGMKSVTMSELQIGDQVQTGMKTSNKSVQTGDQVQTGIKPVTRSELQIGDQVQTGIKPEKSSALYTSGSTAKRMN